MASLVGVMNFDNFLKEYVLEYGGKLVNSEVGGKLNGSFFFC